MPTPEQTGLTWHKSSHSTVEGNNCVEVAWHKSSYSNANGNDCVEVATDLAVTAVRDSKAPEAGHLTVAPSAWREFLAAVTP
ncbi:DUF397 domain-containing protein [Amycolatopsis sp. H20-H5]|uniref:DUF397 domain-containing protein n=1 Tax=Amycolatopsis sp. H20-H5 TaxID=3046309 RepID=UPI002DBDD3A9|nr:DUF397 domain-containing protein [Amycolatopsis sp. H20-H5]MEC3980157.1 DUF397 domain-containing protein [Amycolatopsis sp. H20-H5]